MTITATHHPATYDLCGLDAVQIHAIRLGLNAVIDNQPKSADLDPTTDAVKRWRSYRCAAVTIRSVINSLGEQGADDAEDSEADDEQAGEPPVMWELRGPGRRREFYASREMAEKRAETACAEEHPITRAEWHADSSHSWVLSTIDATRGTRTATGWDLEMVYLHQEPVVDVDVTPPF